jgi:hypothetical protein
LEFDGDEVAIALQDLGAEYALVIAHASGRQSLARFDCLHRRRRVFVLHGQRKPHPTQPGNIFFAPMNSLFRKPRICTALRLENKSHAMPFWLQ